MKKIFTWVFFVLALVLGGCMFIYGEADDSPGGQLLGVVVAAAGIVILVRNKKR